MSQVYGFEAFSTVLLGIRFDVIKRDQVQKEPLEFAEAVSVMFETTDLMLFHELPFCKLWKTKTYKRMEKAWDVIGKNARIFIEQKERFRQFDDGVKNFTEYVNDTPDMTTSEKDVQNAELIAAGVNATANALQWILYNVGRHPEFQDQLLAELEKVIGDSPNITSQNLNQLSLLKDTITESLRVSPVAPLTNRILDHDAVIQGFHIPAGTVINLNHMSTSKDPTNFENPNEFIPERQRSKETYPFTMFPFGAGARICPGKSLAEMELQVAVATVLRNYKIHVEGYVDKVIPNLLLKPDLKTSKLKFEKRQK